MGTERVITYIDGFNLYYGLRDARLHSSRWLDLHGLSQEILKANQRLYLVRYFTTRVRRDPQTARRQATYIDALLAQGNVKIDYGHFLSKRVTCRQCRQNWEQNEEKKTDVNIAVRLLEDAYDDLFDVALVISGDSDLAPPIESVRRRFLKKRVVVAFPPKRQSQELRRVADAAIAISPRTIRNSRLADPVITSRGVALNAPKGWLPRG